MPKLTQKEIAQRGARMAVLQSDLGTEKEDFKGQSSDHRARVNRITSELDRLATEITTGYAEAVQEPLPEPEPEVKVGSGPDEPTTVEQSTKNAEEFLDDLRDGQGDDTPPEPPAGMSTEYSEGWNAFQRGDAETSNPYKNDPSDFADAKRAGWAQGWDAAWENNETAGGEEES